MGCKTGSAPADRPGRFWVALCAGFLKFFPLVCVFLLPHGEIAGAGESGLNPQARQDPAIENIPGGHYAGKSQDRFHGLPLNYLNINI